MAQIDRTLQDTVTSLSPADVLAAAKRFFARENSVYSAFPDMEGSDWLTLRGVGGEEIAIGARPGAGGTVVTASTYLYDQQVARFLTTLPTPDGAGVALIPEELPDSAQAAVREGDSAI